MKIYAVLLYLLFWQPALHAQEPDTIKSKQLMDSAHSFLDMGHFEKALVCIDSASKIYEAHGMWEKQIWALNQKPIPYARLGKVDSATHIVQHNLKYSIEKLGKDNLVTAESYFQYAQILGSQRKYKEGIEYAEKAINLYRKQPAKESLAYLKTCSALGFYYGSFEDYQTSRGYFLEGLAVNDKYLQQQHSRISRMHLLLGIIQNDLGYDDLALESYEFILNMDIKGDKRYEEHKASALNNIGIIHLKNGSNDLALAHYQKSLKEKTDLYGPDTLEVFSQHLNIGIVWKRKNEIEKALSHFQKCLELLDNDNGIGINPKSYISVYINMGDLYFQQDLFSQAKDYFLKVTKLAKPNEHRGHTLYLGKTYTSLAKINVAEGNYDEALRFLKRAEREWQSKYDAKHPSLAGLYIEFGKLYEDKGDFSEALDYFHQSLAANLLSMPDTSNIYTLPKIENYFHQVYLLEALSNKAEVFYGLSEKENNKKNLRYSYEHYLLCDTLIDQIRQSHIEYEDRINFNEAAKEVYQNAIRTCVGLAAIYPEDSFNEKAFYFSEKSKVNTLLQSLQETRALKFAGLPDSLVEKEKQLKSDIEYFQKKQLTALQRKDTSRITSLQNELFETKEVYRKLKTQLENYPAFYQLKYDVEMAKSKAIKSRLLHQNKVMVEYFISPEVLYTFVLISDLSVQVISTELPENFEEIIRLFRQATTDISFIKNTPEKAGALYTETAHILYQLFIDPLQSFLDPEQIKNLIIIPDGQMGYIPMEILLREKVNFSGNASYWDLPYLFRDFTISYGLSATLLFKHSNRSNTFAKRSYGGFAPQYDQATEARLDSLEKLYVSRSGNLLDLPFARKAVTSTANLLEGEAYLSSEASESNFKQQAHLYQILHLSMHGLLDDKSPMYSKLVFSENTDSTEDSYLHAYELYNIQLNADLAVLSACNTGYGQLREGEGVMSLSRAFTYAGCPSLVMSLWSIPDKETASLLQYFFEALKTNQTKDVALNDARNAFLESANQNNPERMHPYYWAGFVVSGDVKALDLVDRPSGKGWLWGGIPILLLILLFFRKRS